MKKISVLVLSLLAFQSYAEEMEFCLIRGDGTLVFCLPTPNDCDGHRRALASDPKAQCFPRPKSN